LPLVVAIVPRNGCLSRVAMFAAAEEPTTLGDRSMKPVTTDTVSVIVQAGKLLRTIGRPSRRVEIALALLREEWLARHGRPVVASSAIKAAAGIGRPARPLPRRS